MANINNKMMINKVIKRNGKRVDFDGTKIALAIKKGFDSVRFELPSCKILYKDGNYTDEEIEMFRTVVERGMPSFYRWARQGGILSA